MAQYPQEHIQRTDANEIAFQHHPPGSAQKYSTNEQGNLHQQPFQATPQYVADAAPAAQDRGVFHNDKPTSVTDTGYGSTPGAAGYDREGLVRTKPEAEVQNKKGGATGKMKDTLHGMKDTVTGHKKHSGTDGPTTPTGTATHPTTYDENTGTHPEKVGCMGKMKDLITGQKPGHGTSTVGTGGNLPSTPTEIGYVGSGAQYDTTPGTRQHKGEGVMDTIPNKIYEGQRLGDYPQVQGTGTDYPQQNYGVQGTGIDYNRGTGTPQNNYGQVQGSGNSGYDAGHGLQGEEWPQPVHPSQAGQHHATTPGATYTDRDTPPSQY